MSNKIGKRTYDLSLATPKLKKTPVRKHQGPPLPADSIGKECAKGQHSKCYAATCRCKKKGCSCEFNI
jgi:hypothetical protein